MCKGPLNMPLHKNGNQWQIYRISVKFMYDLHLNVGFIDESVRRPCVPMDIDGRYRSPDPLCPPYPQTLPYTSLRVLLISAPRLSIIFYSSRATFLTQRRGVYEISVRKVGLYIEDRPTDLSFGPYWGNFKWPYLREGSSDLLRVWFQDGVFGVSGSNGANSFLTKFNRYVGENNARGVIRLVTI